MGFFGAGFNLVLNLASLVVWIALVVAILKMESHIRGINANMSMLCRMMQSSLQIQEATMKKMPAPATPKFTTCQVCGVNFIGDGNFCSERCRRKALKR